VGFCWITAVDIFIYFCLNDLGFVLRFVERGAEEPA
jgi:hypothetical protein